MSNMSKSRLFAALAAAGLAIFAAQAAATIFKPLQPCPIGKVEKLLYDKEGKLAGRICV